MLTEGWRDYEIIAAGGGEKLERWGSVYLLRPDPQAIWPAPCDLAEYPSLNARYVRSSAGGGRWEIYRPFPDEWTIGYKALTFLIKPMGFKHTGLFPEQAYNWERMGEIVKRHGGKMRVLNLFGYTGGASVALARAGAFVTHVDAAKGMVERCRRNAELSSVPADGIRYIVDDCFKFVAREKKRGKRYDAVIMDPPSYGRGPGGETWKLEDDLFALASEVREITEDPAFYLINSYTTGLQPTVIKDLLSLVMHGAGGKSEAYELSLPISDKSRGEIALPCGCSGLWTKG